MNMTVFWDVAQCNLVEVCLRVLIVLMMETVSAAETSVKFYHTTRRNIPENSRLLEIQLVLDENRIYLHEV
jgi:hypothetical protein